MKDNFVEVTLKFVPSSFLKASNNDDDNNFNYFRSPTHSAVLVYKGPSLRIYPCTFYFHIKFSCETQNLRLFELTNLINSHLKEGRYNDTNIK